MTSLEDINSWLIRRYLQRGSKQLEVMSEIQPQHYQHDQSNETIFEQLSSSWRYKCMEELLG